MNKTLIARGASWYDFNLAMGITPQEDETLYRRGPEMSGEISYREWLKELEKLIIERGRANQTSVNQLLQSYQLHPQAKQAIKLVLRSGNTPAIITSGFQPTVEHLARELNVKHYFFGTSIKYSQSGMLSKILSPPHDENFKANSLEQLANRLNIELANVFYIADGDNDTETFKKVHGILVKPSDESVEDWKIKAIKQGERFSSHSAAEHATKADSLIDAVNYALSY